MENVSIQFVGAAGTVTGSKHLLKIPDGNILIDCGLFQGLKDLRKKNWEAFPFDPKEIKYLILTHAHLDHCGAIPILVKQGFNGKIISTVPTQELAKIILQDSAKIQEEDTIEANWKGYTRHEPALPLYTQEDVKRCLDFFSGHPEKEIIKLSDNIQFRFLNNGHILGSSFIDMDCYGKKIIFSGDIGRYNSKILNAPTQIPEADFLVMESTYGNKIHSSIPAEDLLANVINDTIHKKGNLLIPSFAVGRAQELIFMVHELKRQNKIPRVAVYLDTPMGVSATETFINHPEWHKLSEKQCRDMINEIHVVRNYSETEEVIFRKGPKIIIAASGMLTGGRVLNYLKEYIGDERNTVLLSGYQADGTRGRALKEGAHEIKIEGEYFPVYAEIKEITSLSAHADQQEMLLWLSGFLRKPEKIFLVHGEPNALDTFRVKLKNEITSEIIVAKEKEEFELNIKKNYPVEL